MDAQSRSLALIIALAGIALAAWAAVLPHYDAGYLLHGTVLVVLMLPFIAYGSLVESLRPGWLLGTGLVLLAVAVAVVLPLRLKAAPLAETPAYWIPLLTAVVLLPLAYFLGQRRDA